MDERTGRRELSRCKATSFDLCPGCAALYQGDAKAITRSGVWQRLEPGGTVTFVTLTAPPMWRTDAPAELRVIHRYHVAYWRARYTKGPARARHLAAQRPRAVCAWCTKHARGKAKLAGRRSRSVAPVIHGPDDPLAGLPVDLDAFDYAAAAEWNWELGDRWSRLMVYLERELGHRPEFLKAREVQRRGLAHLHVLLAGNITEEQLRRAIDRTNESYANPNRGWGHIADLQHLTNDPNSPDGRQVGRISAYIAKYVTKGAPSTVRSTAANPHAKTHFQRLERASQHVAVERAARRPGAPCPNPTCGGELALADADTLRCRTCRCEVRHRLGRYAEHLGIRSQPITKSQHWATEHRESRRHPGRWLPVYGRHCRPKGLTFTALRRNRARYAAATSQRPAIPARWRWIGPSSHPSRHPSRHSDNNPSQPHAPPRDLPDPF